VNPPRPTPAKIRTIQTKLARALSDCDMMLQGNVHSSDAFKLDYVRKARNEMRDARATLEALQNKGGLP
jgi:hypothetical protein